MYPKLQQTKMLVMCQRFGDLFLFGLVLLYYSFQTKHSKGRMATYSVDSIKRTVLLKVLLLVSSHVFEPTFIIFCLN